MPYCLKCREEFQDWVTLCPDCSLALVDSLPELSKPKQKPEPKEEPIKEPLFHVATAPNESLAIMWAGILENEGIYALIKSGDLKAAYYMPSLLSSCEIHVLESQVEKAKLILEPLIRDSET